MCQITYKCPSSAGRRGQRKRASNLIGEEPLVVDACEASDGDGDPQHEHEVVGVGGVDGGRLVDVGNNVRGGGDLCGVQGRGGSEWGERMGGRTHWEAVSVYVF